MAPNMKLLLQITYNTRWGERLVVVSPGNRRLPMEYCGEGRWRGCIARYLPGREYSYEVVRDAGTAGMDQTVGYSVWKTTAGR